MKIPHYTLIDNHVAQKIDWNFIRDNPKEPSYFIPFSTKEYIESVELHAKNSFYADILDYCKKQKITTILSLGSGRCILEYAIKTNSDAKVIVSDKSNSINRIKDFQIFDDALQIDYLTESKIDFVDENTMVLLSRIDTKYNNKDFKELFAKFARNNINHICFIPAELLDWKIFLIETKIFLKSLITNKKRIFCGYARTKSEFYKKWKNYYSVSSEIKQKQLFFLTKNK